MHFKRTPMRYAHTNGHTNCTYTKDGGTIITCGSDGDIRKWQGIEDDDPSSKCLGEFLWGIVQYDNRLLVSTDLNVVQAFTFPEIDQDGTEFRFTAPATCIRVNERFIAAGSEDTEIKVLRRNESGSEFELKGHTGPILHIDLSVKDILASSSGDGTIKIWSLEDKKELKTISGLPKFKSFESADQLGSPCFDPKTGKCLAYASGKQIIVLNCNTWETQFTLSDDNIGIDYTFCAFSPCGKFLAAGTQAGELSLWDVLKKESISEYSSDKESEGITVIVWNPSNNGEFAYCDKSGQLGTAVISAKGDVHLVTNNLEMEFEGVEFRDDEADEDLDNENCFSLEKIKNETLGLKEDSNHSEVRTVTPVSVDVPSFQTYNQQKPFQPGSTPKDLEHRYLVWNNVGIVWGHTGDGEGSIDVEFHDVNTHHSLHMNNYLNHTMAGLSSTVLAMSGHLSTKLVCIVLGNSGSREWSVEMPDCEGIVAITATSKLVAVATDNRFLRLFSVMGTQREVISVPGPVVAISGIADKLIVVYHSAPASEDQHMSAMLLQTVGLTLRCREIRISLPPKRKLTWIGYTDCGSPVCCDNMGLLQLYSVKNSCWYPVCDTMKHTQCVSNNYFIIDVSEKNQLVQAVLCRGSSYPMTNPRPMVTELPLQIPFCEIDSEKSTLEEKLLRWSNLKMDGSEKIVKETAIKLFALACQTEMEGRAKELIEMIGSAQLLNLAVKFAVKLGRIHLADKLRELLPQLEEQEKEQEKQTKDLESEAISILQSSSFNSSLLLVQNNDAIKLSSSSPIAPKPMVLHSKRNPFKKAASNSPNPAKHNPLSHLTDKAIGLDSKRSQTPVQDIQTPVGNESIDDVIPCSVNKENKAKNESIYGMWSGLKKKQLEQAHNEVSSAKTAITNNKESSDDATASSIGMKRKFSDENSGEQSKSGIAKLAKFGFNKL